MPTIAVRTFHALTIATTLWALGFQTGLVVADDELALRRVVLYSSGVGFFEHQGVLEGNKTIGLQFDVSEINDLLKSLVVQDVDGGDIASVTYGSQVPLSRTLRSFSVDLTNNVTLSQLLVQMRGQRVHVQTSCEIEGTILGIESRRRRRGDVEFEDDFLNLITDSGLRSVSMQDIQSIRLLDQELNEELQKALALLASSRRDDQKSVTFDFRGQGQRRVRVGYIREFPIWKTSYRLVLDDEKPPYLQGWAIVENTTDADWQNVRLSLVSGRPISFTMNLYEPLYLQRPSVAPELYGSVSSTSYDQNLLERTRGLSRGRASVGGRGEFFAGGGMGGMGGGGMGGGSPGSADNADYGGGYGAGYGGYGDSGGDGAESEDLFGGEDFDMDKGVTAAATATEVGELFRYEIDAPVTLARNRSAMLPIVNHEVQGEKLSIYNRSVHAAHPLSGFQMTNSTDLHLMQGPVTVYDQGAYAGDARFQDIAPGADRLISYALDLDLEVAPASDTQPRRLTQVQVAQGILSASYRLRRANHYTVKNSAAEKKKLLIEQPIDSEWKLASPNEAHEQTRSMYRFVVEVEPDRTIKFAVEEQRVISEQMELLAIDDSQLAFFVQAAELSEEAKTSFGELARRRHSLAATVADRSQIEVQLAEIDKEQQRIVRNMSQLDRTSDLYRRYVKKFDDQEGQIETLRKHLAGVREKGTVLQKELEDYVSKLEF